MQALPQDSAVSIESLLAHADWVRALARRLVSDPASADDVEQEVWRAALENPPREGSNPRGWLASVARNAARSFGRSNARRGRREGLAARPEALPPTSELVAEAERARELAGEVLALEEPYRTVLLLRFWRALTPDEIASAQSIPRETVRTQLKRGLERLRESLDRRFGDRESWLAALAPLAKETHVALGAAVGGGLLLLALKCAAVAALVGALWYAWPDAHMRADHLVGEQPAGTDSVPALDTSDVSDPARAPTRTGALDAGASERSGSATPAKHRFRGQVLDLEGHPVAGLELEWRSDEQGDWPHWEGDVLRLRKTTVTVAPRVRQLLREQPAELERFVKELDDEPGLREALLDLPMPRLLSPTLNDGGFDIELGEGTWTPECTDPHRMIVAQIETRDFKGWTLLVAPSSKLMGRVVDEAGLPLPDAQFSYSFYLERLDAFSDLHDQSWQWRVLGMCSHEGTFSFDRVLARSEIRVEVQKSGYAQRRLEPDGANDLAREIVLAMLEVGLQPHLSGMVVDQRGNPVAQVKVSLGQDKGLTDEQGRFDYPFSTYHPDESLTAVKQGYQATVLAGFGEAQMQSRTEILLRLGAPALSIEGHVRLPDGSNTGRCHVQVIDGTPFGTTPCTLEDVSAGNYQCGIDTDERGHFVLEGLCARDYRLLAYDPQHGQIAYTDPIAAGSKGVVVQDKPEDFLPTLRGRVVTRHGLPLEGVDVGRSMCFYKSMNSWSSKVTGKVSTDAQGRFELKDFPRKWSRIELGGPSIRVTTRDLPAQSAADLELLAELEVRTRLEIMDSTIDEVRFLDELGERAHPIIETPEGTSEQFSLPRSAGRFPTFAIYDSAVMALLCRGGEEVRRVPVEIRREKLLTLRF